MKEPQLALLILVDGRAIVSTLSQPAPERIAVSVLMAGGFGQAIVERTRVVMGHGPTRVQVYAPALIECPDITSVKIGSNVPQELHAELRRCYCAGEDQEPI